MSKKRTAERELNHDNWNEEETPDEAGQFKVASEESMRERKVIKARRRNPAGSNPSENLFTAFKGKYVVTCTDKPDKCVALKCLSLQC